MARSTRPAKKPKVPHQRREGGTLIPEAMDAALLARGLSTRDLARIAKVDVATVGAARKGRRVSRHTVLKIVAALDLVPVSPAIAQLVGLRIEQNGGATKKRRKKVA